MKVIDTFLRIPFHIPPTDWPLYPFEVQQNGGWNCITFCLAEITIFCFWLLRYIWLLFQLPRRLNLNNVAEVESSASSLALPRYCNISKKPHTRNTVTAVKCRYPIAWGSEPSTKVRRTHDGGMTEARRVRVWYNDTEKDKRQDAPLEKR